MNPKIGICWWCLTSCILCFTVNITGIRSLGWVLSQLMKCATVGIFVGLFNLMSSFCLYLLNRRSGTDCWSSYSYFRASYMFLRQHEVSHRLHASAVPFDASCAWNVCVIRESSSACTNFIQPREFRGFGGGCGLGFISEIWRRGTEWADSEASRHIMKDRSVQELRTFLDVSTLQDEDITLRRNVASWLLIDSVISQKNGILHTAVFGV